MTRAEPRRLLVNPHEEPAVEQVAYDAGVRDDDPIAVEPLRRLWLDRLGPWIPKAYREGWLHDILEDREHWRDEGVSGRKIAYRTGSQFLNAMIFNPATLVVGVATWLVSKLNGPWFGG